MTRGVGLAMRDGGQTQLEREAARLAALLHELFPGPVIEEAALVDALPATGAVVPYRLDDAEVVFVSMGTTASTVRTAVDEARERGVRAS